MICRLLYILVQCTWGIIQTIIGFILFIANAKKEHFIYRGEIVTKWKYIGNVSLGLFIFIEDIPNKDISNQLLAHEYGHSLQSLILGILYPIVILIPSLVWCGLPYFKNYRKLKGISYYSMYTEKWANFLAESITGQKIFLK